MLLLHVPLRIVYFVLPSIAATGLLGLILYFLLIGPFRKEEPRIVQLQESIKMAGVSLRTNQESIYKDAARLGKEYQAIQSSNLIRHKKSPWCFVAVSKDYEGSGSWTYLMGDVVTSFEDKVSGLEYFEIPAGMYAVFTIRPKSRFAWGIAIGRIKKYIFTDWFVSSEYEPDHSVVGDFELHDERSLQKHPSIDLYVAIKKRK